eukprot:1704351-Prymnesium_polylepis.1
MLQTQRQESLISDRVKREHKEPVQKSRKAAAPARAPATAPRPAPAPAPASRAVSAPPWMRVRVR